MMYAIVDIETTGGYASGNGITEISIQIHDGLTVVETWDSLINPEQYIPSHIESLTGISNELVADAPVFNSVSADIYALLHNKVFVAHNVNFDYSFIRHHLALSGFTLNTKKLCTVRLSRKLFPGYASYSLGKLCGSLQIPLENRHRAGGDAAATAILFTKLLEADMAGIIGQSLAKASREQALPPNLSKSYIDRLPSNPGIYYFKDQKGKVIYVGKAKNLRKRVCSHFTGNNVSRQRQEFLKNIHTVDYEICGTELMALIHEATEIKRLWPENNRALKKFEQKYALFLFEDQKGYLRLGIDKFKKQGNTLYTFNNLAEGHNLLRILIRENQLCEKLCFIQHGRSACTHHATQQCNGACIGNEHSDLYNARVEQAIGQLKDMLPSFAIIDQGRTDDEQSCLWVEAGKFYGMGYISGYTDLKRMEDIKSTLQPYPSSDYILNIILSYTDKYPEKKRDINFQAITQ